MRILFVVLVSLLALLTSTHAAAPPKGGAEAVATQAEITEAMRLATLGSIEMRAGKVDAALDALTQASSAPGFSALPRNFQLATEAMLVAVLSQKGMDREAYEGIQSLLTRYSNEVTPHYWSLSAFLSWQVGEYADALAALQMLVSAPDGPELYWRDNIIIKVLRDSRSKTELADPRYELMKAVWVSGASPPDGYTRPNWLWFELLGEHVERGEYNQARAVMVRLNDPEYVAPLYFDRRFEKFIATAPTGGFRLAQVKELAWARRLVEDHPRELRAINRLIGILTQQGALEDALEVADSALTRLQVADSVPFDDVDEYLHWLHDHRSRVLFRLGRHDEAIVAQNAAQAASKDDGISHKVNLGVLSNLLSKPSEAVLAVGTVHGASDFGRMAQQDVLACAYSQLGDTAGLTDALTYLKEHVEDGYEALQSAMICANKAVS